MHVFLPLDVGALLLAVHVGLTQVEANIYIHYCTHYSQMLVSNSATALHACQYSALMQCKPSHAHVHM